MEVPTSMLLCPITLATFRNPVVAEDGNTYEKEAIEAWIRKNGTSPITNAKISQNLFPNHAVNKMIDQFETSLRDKNYQYTLDVDVKKKKGRPLFQTSEKTIYHAEWLPDNNGRPDIVLLKIDGARANKEASFYVDLSRHPHIVRTFGLVHEEGNDTNAVILLQEYASLGSLHKLLSQQKQPLVEKILIEIFLQIFDAMSYLALNNVAHGDLTCRNVLVFRFDEKDPRNIVVKLTGFGLSHRSKIYTQVARTSLSTIPVRYAAPEILSTGVTANECTEKSDVYAMGVLIWEAYSRGAIPWSKIQNDDDVIRRVRNGDMLPQPANCNPQYWNIIVKTWSPIPSERPTFGQLKKLFEDQLYSDRMSVSSPNLPNYDQHNNQSSPRQFKPARNDGTTSVRDELHEIDLVHQTIQIDKQMYHVKKRYNCGNEDLYALEGDQRMRGCDARCPKCDRDHVKFDRASQGFYASVKSIHDKIYNDKPADECSKDPKKIERLPFVNENLPPLDHPILGKNKGIEGNSNSCYMDSTIFCMFAYSNVFDSLLYVRIDKKPLKNLQKLLRENIVNALRSESGFVERDTLFHLRVLLSEATGDQSFQEMEKDPSDFLKALEKHFHYAPLKTIRPDQSPEQDQSNITTNIIWEMFDANPQNLTSTNIASIFRNSLSEIPAKLATIPPFLVLVAPRHTRSQRSYRYIIPDRQIILDSKIVQLVCLRCKRTSHDTEQLCDFYFCDGCYSKESPSISMPPTDTTIICYCAGCSRELHKNLTKQELLREHSNPKQMKNVSYKLNLFAVLCIETSHYVAFVKCHKPDEEHEWLFFDSMSDRINNEKNVPCVSLVSGFDRCIEKAEKEKNFFEDLDRRRNQGRPTSQIFNDSEMRQLRLFRDGAFFFYENSAVNYQ